MVSLNNYGTIDEDAMLLEALKELEASTTTVGPEGQPPRAVLVQNGAGEIVGQLGHLDFLKVLEPKYNLLGDLDILSRATIDPEFLEQMVELLGFWQGSLENQCHRAVSIEVKWVMRPVKESLDAETSLTEAIHKMIMWQSMRALVTERGEVVGVVRLTDLFREVSDCMKRNHQRGQDK